MAETNSTPHRAAVYARISTSGNQQIQRAGVSGKTMQKLLETLEDSHRYWHRKNYSRKLLVVHAKQLLVSVTRCAIKQLAEPESSQCFAELSRLLPTIDGGKESGDENV